MTHLIYLHGFVSSTNGRKAQYLHPRLASQPDVNFRTLEFSPTPAPITIIHGTEDEVVPISASRDYAQACPD
jgi:predicted esterase